VVGVAAVALLPKTAGSGSCLWKVASRSTVLTMWYQLLTLRERSPTLPFAADMVSSAITLGRAASSGCRTAHTSASSKGREGEKSVISPVARVTTCSSRTWQCVRVRLLDFGNHPMEDRREKVQALIFGRWVAHYIGHGRVSSRLRRSRIDMATVLFGNGYGRRASGSYHQVRLLWILVQHPAALG
jgi:hypothetical protein